MKRIILAALVLATFTVDAQAGPLRRLFGFNKTKTVSVSKSVNARCHIVNGKRVCGQ